MAAFTLEASRTRNAGSYVAGPFAVPAGVATVVVVLTTSATGTPGRFDGVVEWGPSSTGPWSPRHWFGADNDAEPTEQTVSMERPAGMTHVRCTYTCASRINIQIVGQTLP